MNEFDIFEQVEECPEHYVTVIGYDYGISKKSGDPYLSIYTVCNPFTENGLGLRTPDPLYVSPKFCKDFADIVSSLAIGSYILPCYYINGNFKAISSLIIK